MKIDILTLFPDMFAGPFGESIIKRAIQKNKVEIEIHNLRKWSKDKHKTVDGKPFGGGAGMVMMVEVLDKAVRELKKTQGSEPSFPRERGVQTADGSEPPRPRVIFLTPQGKPYKQEKARELSEVDHIIFICGHYEGIDERIRESLVDEEISIGDYVLTGGEIPTMVVVDSIVRLLPGVLGNEESIKDESFGSNLLEYPQYTRPADYKGMKVPEVLLSGHHKEIEEWRKKESIKRTKKVRPDLV